LGLKVTAVASLASSFGVVVLLILFLWMLKENAMDLIMAVYAHVGVTLLGSRITTSSRAGKEAKQ
jgi:hypothetical protein